MHAFYGLINLIWKSKLNYGVLSYELSETLTQRQVKNLRAKYLL